MSQAGKRAAAQAAARLVQPGMIVGLGTGSTAAFFHEALGMRIQSGLKIRAVPTSEATARTAERLGIPLVALTPSTCPDLTVDGADEIDPNLFLIKGGGGALLREKLVAQCSKEVVIIADSSKYVERLGTFPLPVIAVPFAAETLMARIRGEWEVAVRLRRREDGQVHVTDDGLWVLELPLGLIRRPALTEQKLRHLPGVVEVGLFINLASRAILGHEDGRVETLFPKPS